MSPVWFNIILAVSGLIGGALINFFLIGHKVGQYEEKVESQNEKIRAMQNIFIEKQLEHNKRYDDLQDKVEEFIGQISYLEGKINGRRS